MRGPALEGTVITRLDLRIDLSGQPVSGSVAITGGKATRFSGYTGLIAALEALRLAREEKEESQRKEQS
jgi:hypothetical protein